MSREAPGTCPTQNGPWYLSYEASDYTKRKIISLREEKRVPQITEIRVPAALWVEQACPAVAICTWRCEKGAGPGCPRGATVHVGWAGRWREPWLCWPQQVFSGQTRSRSFLRAQSSCGLPGAPAPRKTGRPRHTGARAPTAGFTGKLPAQERFSSGGIWASAPLPRRRGSVGRIELPGTRRQKSRLKPFGDKPPTLEDGLPPDKCLCVGSR